MTRRRRRRPGVDARAYSRRQKSTLTQLVFAIAALTLLLLAWSTVADGAAGCFSRMAPPAPESAPPAGHDAQDPARHDAPTPTIRVKTRSEVP